MLYKPIQWTIPTEDLKNNPIVFKKFNLEEEDKTILYGTVVYISEDNPAVNALVSLKESNINEDNYTDKYLAFTDENGNFIISFIPEEGKMYKIIVYFPSTNSNEV